MKHSVPHDLDVPTAKRVAEHAFESYRAQFARYQPTFRWVDDRTATVGFTARGIVMTGTIEIRPREIDVGLEVPLLFRPFRGRAMVTIDREIRAWVAKAKAGGV